MFTICSIAKDPVQYRAMRESFIAAGFDTTRCDFRLYDNSQRNEHDPYQVIPSLNDVSPDRFVILCHCDVRINRDAGYDCLLDRLNQLTAIDPRWAVAGNFGVMRGGRRIGTVNDYSGTSFPGPLPQKVTSLDEDFLVFPPNRHLSCTPGLSGFHLYGLDVCLNAYFSSHTCYVIDFELTHLGAGPTLIPEFKASVHNFINAWSPRFALAVVKTPTDKTLRLSKWAPVRWVLNSWKFSMMLDVFGLSPISSPEIESYFPSEIDT